jgi:hypothetical protein
MVTSIADWFKSFDIAKAVLLAIVAVVASWYDLRGQVEIIRQESVLRWSAQEKVDTNQNQAIRDIKDELKDGFKELKQVVRDNAQDRSVRR